MNLLFGKPKRVTALTDLHKRNRVKFCKAHKHEDWSQYIFTDEKKFEVSGPLVGERYEEGHRPVAPTKVHAGKVNVWWGIGLRYNITPHLFTENLNSTKYISILTQHLPDVEEGDWILMNDNDPKHRSKATMRFIDGENIPLMKDWPSMSPDLNPMENVWSILSRMVYSKPIATVADLKKRIKKCISEVPDEVIQSAIDSIPNRLKRVIKAKGEPIPY